MLGDVATEAARRFGDRTAYVAATGWSASFTDLHDWSDEVAVGLLDRGVGEGDVVALVLPSSPEHVVAYLAAAKIGAVTTSVNPRLTASERAGVLAVAQPRLTIATRALAPDGSAGPVEEIALAPEREELLRTLRARGSTPPPLAPATERPVAIVFTSGTTGSPRGAVYGDRQLDFVTATDTGGRWGTGGAMLAGTSMSHLAFMTKLPGRLMSGSPTYLVDRWRASEALAMTAEHRMTRIGGIPTQVALMLRDPDFDRYDLSSVEVVVIGGGPATPSLVREARARFGCPVLVRYSCTEAGIGTGTSVDDPPEDGETTVGRPQPGVQVRIRAGDLDLPTGEVGEVELRSPAAMTGYHRDPEATATTLTADGFVRTGDVGWLDDAGRLHLVGRSKEMYVRGGYNVYPAEVEQVLSRHPDVADVAVAPRPDDVMGEIGVAVVVPRRGVVPPGLDDLREFAATALARHKLPEALVLADDLPLTPMDKVDRRALAALVQTPDTPSGRSSDTGDGDPSPEKGHH